MISIATKPADAFAEDCPSAGVLSRLGERWAMLLLVRLSERPMRFGELRRGLGRITQKMLTQSLRRLERDGLVSRTTLSERPLAVEYRLTERAETVVPIIASLKGWAEQNWQAVGISNVEFDGAEST